MSEKLTEEKIEQMILELLQEEQKLDEFKVKITGKWTDDKSNIGLKRLSQLGHGGNGSAASKILADLAALDGGVSDLEDADFQKASDDRATNPDNWKYTQNIVSNSSVSGIKNWKAVGGGYSALATSHGLGKGSNYSDWHTVIKTLWSAGNKTDAQTIFDEFVDIKYTKTGKSIPSGSTSVYQKVKKLLGTSPGPGSSDLLDKLLMDLDKAKEYEPQTIARPVMTTQSTVRGSGYAGALNSTFSGLFKNADTMRKRFARIQEVSEAFVKGTSLKTGSTSAFGNSTETLNAIVAMDWISAMVKEMDKGSSAYVFEAFCSMIAGGGGIGGANKAGDFTIWNSKGLTDEGSAKYLQKKTGSDQAVSGFTVGDPVLYVQAHKRGKGASGGLKNTSDPDIIQQIDLYVYEVEFSKINQKKANKNSATVTTAGSGAVSHKFKPDAKGNVRIEFTVKNPDFTIFIASPSNIKSFKASLEQQLSSKGTQSQKDSYKLMKEYFEETYKADTQLKKYLGQTSKTINATTLQHGTDALAASLKADSKLESLFNELRGSSGGVTGTGTSRKVTESKMQSLDDLIAETMRDIKKKRKK